jgi:pantetheine-phosphate adenylyltransferase
MSATFPDGPGADLVAVYPGSFDPITNGHVHIVERAVRMFDRVVVAVGRHPTKPGFFSVEEREALIARSLAHVERARAASFTGLVVDFCRSQGARVIVRGLRAVGDFEPELQMGLANRTLAPEIETVFLIPGAEHMFISSSLVREIAGHRGHFQPYVPPVVAEALARRFGGS